MARRPLVMGNWKLNGSKAFTKELIEGLKAELHDVTGCDVAIAPPVMYLGTAEAALSGCGCSCGGKSVIQLGAQNVDINVKGAFTGDISSEMLKDFGAKYIIIGHSERRTYHKESDELVAKKFGVLKLILLLILIRHYNLILILYLILNLQFYLPFHLFLLDFHLQA